MDADAADTALDREIQLRPFAVLLAVTCGLLLALPGTGDSQTYRLSEDHAATVTAAIESREYGRVTSLLIEQEGKILYERYFNGADADSHHNLRSVGKTVTGIILGAAIDDGLIAGENVRAATYFDDLRPFRYPDPRKDAITIKDLLTMSGPLECDDWNSFSRGNEERMYLVEDWSAFYWNLPVKNRPSWEIPADDGGFGRLFKYCTAGAQLVGEIVDRVTDEPFTEYAQRRVFDRIGITEPKWNVAATGTPHLGGGLELTTRDWAALARLALHEGRAGDEQVLSRAWMQRSMTDYVRIDDRTNYGYFWWRPAFEVDGKRYVASAMNGAGGNRVYVLPEFALIAVITKNDFGDREAHPRSDALFQEVIVERLVAQ